MDILALHSSGLIGLENRYNWLLGESGVYNVILLKSNILLNSLVDGTGKGLGEEDALPVEAKIPLISASSKTFKEILTPRGP